MLKTDYKDDILNTDVNVNRKFNIVRSNGTVVEQNVELRETTAFKQEGDSFGAKDINETNEAIVDVKGQIRTNLLNPTAPTQTVNGVTFTNNGDGTYTANGTVSDGNIGVILMNSTDFAALKNTKLVGCPTGGSHGTYLLNLTCYNGDTWLKDFNDYGNGIVISNIPSNATKVKVMIAVRKGQTVNNLIFKPMLTTDLDVTYDDFVPYTGDSGRLNEDVANLIKGISPITNSDIDTILNS